MTLWTLPGPSRFVASVASEALHGRRLVPILAPDPRPPGLAAALEDRLNEAVTVTALRPPADETPVRVIADTLGLVVPPSIAELRDSPEFSSRVLIIDLNGRAWARWELFLRQWRETGRDSPLAPVLVVIAPADIARDRIRSALGDEPFVWSGRIRPSDARIVVEDVLARRTAEEDDIADLPEDLHAACTSVIIETVGWNLGLAAEMAERSVEEMLDPLPLATPARTAFPHWGNGLVDLWRDEMFVDPLVLAARGESRTLAIRVWRGQMAALYPVIDRISRAVITRHRPLIDTLVNPFSPFLRKAGIGLKEIIDPDELEIGDLKRLLQDRIDPAVTSMIRAAHALRTKLAHQNPAPADLILDLFAKWGAVEKNMRPRGWSWPRAGQRLTLMVGPSGAGKSRWLRCNGVDGVVSSDEIRRTLFGSLATPGRQAEVFAEVYRRALARLAVGRSVTIDATFIRANDRQRLLTEVPEDIPLTYVIVDRPLDAKLRDRGERSERQVLETHATFQADLASALAGDGRAEVLDVRQESAVPVRCDDESPGRMDARTTGGARGATGAIGGG